MSEIIEVVAYWAVLIGGTLGLIALAIYLFLIAFDQVLKFTRLYRVIIDFIVYRESFIKWHKKHVKQEPEK